ncbi:hypothetical protein ACROYT_G022075 [Oculina patagonica]
MFRPILRLMKLTAEYYGDVSLDTALEADSSVFSRFYCAIVLLGQWVVFAQASTSLFFEGLNEMKTFYFLMLFTIWYLQAAAVNTTCHYILHKRQKVASPLQQFVSNLLSTTSDFSGIKRYKLNLAMATACAFAAFNTICIVVLDYYRNSSVARFRPWNGLFAYRLIHFVFGAFDSFAWALPFSLYYVSCELLIQIFENLERKFTTESPEDITIETLRQEHHKLCETVALADKVFSPLLLATVILDVPIMCINFHQLVKSPMSGAENTIYVVSVLYWSITVTGKLAFVMRSGVKVNEKLVGIIISYFAVLVTLPS